MQQRNKNYFRNRKKYCANKSKSVDSCIDTFKKKIKEGPYYICCVCNRMH